MSDKVSYVKQRKWRIVIAVIGLFAIVQACSSTQRSGIVIPKRLIIGLDGVPYSTFKKLQDGGHFRNFHPASPMVASFPSISDPNWTRLFNLPLEQGMTKGYFDPSIKTKYGMGDSQGSLISDLSKSPGYERVMDFKLKGVWEHVTLMLWTQTTALYWLESLEKDFFNFRGQENYFALIINTDILSHTEGETALLKYLAVIDDRVEAIQKRYLEIHGTSLEVILVSDHGNSFVAPIDIPWESEIETQGWTINTTITNSKDVAFFVPEILGSGTFYCKPEMKRELALALARVSHIQSAMYEDLDHQIHVVSSYVNEGIISYDEKKDLLNYKIIKGQDVFDQLKYFKKGPLRSDIYFSKSFADTFPNSIMRIWEGFNKNSSIRPYVLANADFNYVFGNKALRLLTDIKGFTSTHGSLLKDESWGIFVSTTRTLPAIRPQDFSKIIDVRELVMRVHKPVE